MKFHIPSKRTLIILGIIIALIIVVFLYYRSTIFSKEILYLEVLGPERAALGEEIEYTVKYKNNGNFALEKPRLIFELPEHSLTEDGKSRLTNMLEDLDPGEGGSMVFTTRLLGKEGEVKTARASLTYVPHNLSVRYESTATRDTAITEAPLELAYDNFPSSVESGSEFTYALRYVSWVDYPLENISIRVTPVSGFTIKSAEPRSLDNAEWKLPTLMRGQGSQISIRGLISSSTETQLVFSVRLGMWIDGVFVTIKEASRTLEVTPSKTPQQDTALEISQTGESVEGGYQVTWQAKALFHDAKNVAVTATLPSNVALADVLIPETEADYFSFNVSSRSITWRVENLAVGSARAVSFQVMPSGVGVGASVIGQALISGEDQITGKAIQNTAPPVTATFISL